MPIRGTSDAEGTSAGMVNAGRNENRGSKESKSQLTFCPTLFIPFLPEQIHIFGLLI